MPKQSYYRHGTRSGYGHGCRCAPCRRAETAGKRLLTQRKQHQFRKTGRLPRGISHGECNTYQVFACRCQKCRDANAAYMRSYRERRLSGDVRSIKPPVKRSIPVIGHPKGEATPNARLTNADVRRIRKTNGLVTAAEWSRALGVSYQPIRNVQLGRSWTHVK